MQSPIGRILLRRNYRINCVLGRRRLTVSEKRKSKDLPPAALAVRDAFVDGKTKEVVDLLKRSKAEELLSSGEFDSAEEIIKLLQNID